MLINSCIERVGQSATLSADKRLVPCLTFSSVRSSINDVIIMEMSSEQTEIFYQIEKQKLSKERTIPVRKRETLNLSPLQVTSL